nr:GGDEF domain-containing protein [Halalkalibacter urbisdiaboli]
MNDELGHVVGDKVLVEMAALVENMLVETDLFGRWGGEEFVILTFKRNKQEAIELAEKLRKGIETHPFSLAGKVTSSFGVTSTDDRDTTETLMNRVDEALYSAKKEGRNQVRY